MMVYPQTLSSPDQKMTEKERFVCLLICIFLISEEKAPYKSSHQPILMAQWPKLHDMPNPKPFTGKGNATTMTGSL